MQMMDVNIKQRGGRRAMPIGINRRSDIYADWPL